MVSDRVGRSGLGGGLCLGLVLVLAAVAGAQVGNDTCDQAVNNGFFLVNGPNGGLTNVGATASGVVPSCAGTSIIPIPLPVPTGSIDVWYGYTATSSCTITIGLSNSTLAASFVAVWDGNNFQGPSSCGNLPELACASLFGNVGGVAGTSQVQVAVTVGDFLFIQVGVLFGATGTFTVDINPALTLTFSAPAGPGSLNIANDCGNPNDLYVTAIALAQGQTPNGWFFGLDINFLGLLQEVSFGPPFHGALDAAGSSLFTVPAGMPSGLTLYAVTVTLDQNTGVPNLSSDVVTFVTP